MLRKDRQILQVGRTDDRIRFMADGMMAKINSTTTRVLSQETMGALPDLMVSMEPFESSVSWEGLSALVSTRISVPR